MAKQVLPAGVPSGETIAPIDEGKPPPFGRGKPADSDGPLPRVVDQLERATKGTKRFKIRCNNYHPKPVRYVLATDEASAKRCYLTTTGADKELAKAGPTAEPIDLVVTELAD